MSGAHSHPNYLRTWGVVLLAVLLACTQGLGMHLHLHLHDHHPVAASPHEHPNPIHLSHFGESSGHSGHGGHSGHAGHSAPASEIDISLDCTLIPPLALVILATVLMSMLGVPMSGLPRLPARPDPPPLSSRTGRIPLRRGPPFFPFQNFAIH